MIKLILTDVASGKSLKTEGFQAFGTDKEIVLCTTTPSKAHGVFKTGVFTVAGTTQLVVPKSGGSLELTDLIVSFEGEKVATVAIAFFDGTNVATIINANLNKTPVNIASNFAGRWHGWEDAYIRVVITGADSIGSVAVGYINHGKEDTLSYSAWNEAR